MSISSYWFIIPGITLVALAAGYFLGPTIERPRYADELPDVPEEPEALDEYVRAREAEADLRPNNEARIHWAGDKRQPTEFAFVYLHGFGASYRDAFPVNVNLGDIFGANVFLARWGGHGLRAESALREFTPEGAWWDAREALAIGRRIGKNVIVMSTSTGGTLAFKLAADFPDAVHALINIGPNVEDDQPGASWLMSPWGHELAHLTSLGQRRKIKHEEPEAPQYFDTLYPAEALVRLEVLVQTTMQDETFERVACPVATVFYKENFFKKDDHVEVSRYPEVHALLATPEDRKQLLPLPTPKTHFVASDIKSRDWPAAQRAIVGFCQDVLGMSPLQPVDYLSDAPGF